MRNNREYIICSQIAIYLRMQYSNVFFHFDLAGLNLSKAQAGMTKALQKQRGFPDLFIAAPRGKFAGAFYEIKAEGTELLKKSGGWKSDHIREQEEMILLLRSQGFAAGFAIGFDDLKAKIDNYLNTTNY